MSALRYRDHWTIDVLSMGPFSYQGTHDDYDGGLTYSFDTQPADKRCFAGPTIADVQEQIDEYEAEQDDEPSHPDRLDVDSENFGGGRS